ncbi:hypothetical protein ADT71_22625 [Novosphingobium sp. ST904]|nr:hypothetical protein ADT71_22625 [Novosphingobium sp. ST904]
MSHGHPRNAAVQPRNPHRPCPPRTGYAALLRRIDDRRPRPAEEFHRHASAQHPLPLPPIRW